MIKEGERETMKKNCLDARSHARTPILSVLLRLTRRTFLFSFCPSRSIITQFRLRAVRQRRKKGKISNVVLWIRFVHQFVRFEPFFYDSLKYNKSLVKMRFRIHIRLKTCSKKLRSHGEIRIRRCRWPSSRNAQIRLLSTVHQQRYEAFVNSLSFSPFLLVLGMIRLFLPFDRTNFYVFSQHQWIRINHAPFRLQKSIWSPCFKFDDAVSPSPLRKRRKTHIVTPMWSSWKWKNRMISSKKMHDAFSMVNFSSPSCPSTTIRLFSSSSGDYHVITDIFQKYNVAHQNS